ncbi:hypothetical protein EGH22_20585 [Halomicroarcula sp. F28]|uniref:hypothetical protein n=1 Tax=Haloarcula salinisoli TaxID=2487746 RepID=UPI001C73828F|nr:hypothetical protein [Halomicroarcula salinisoli]MBX0288731.1 hypothetical protein [Halomicroarcula salinisoli]
MSNLKHPVETEPEGFVAVYEDSYRGGGIAIGGYSRRDPSGLAQRNPDAAIVNVKRARYIASEYHGWDVPPEDEIREAAMAGR